MPLANATDKRIRLLPPFILLLMITLLIVMPSLSLTAQSNNGALAGSVTPTPAVSPISATGAATSSADGENSTTLASGDYTLYPLANYSDTINSVFQSPDGPGDPFVKPYYPSPLTVKFTFGTDTIRLENYVETPLEMKLLSPGVFGIRYSDQLPADREFTDFTMTLLAFVTGPQEVWLFKEQATSIETYSITGMLVLPGQPIVPDPRQNGATKCPGALDPRLKLNDKALVVAANPNNLRADPNPKAKLLGTLKYGDEVDVLNGPKCAGTFAYWQVSSLGKTGWTADSQDDGYWLLPKRYADLFLKTQSMFDKGQIQTIPLISKFASNDVAATTPTEGPTLSDSTPTANQCPGSPAPRLSIGGKGRVLPGDPNWIDTAPLNSRAHPGQSRRIVQIPAGGVFDVIDGPQCADGITWWKVSYRGYTGWTGESDVLYWAEPTK